MRNHIVLSAFFTLFLLASCESMYFSSMEKIGIHKRDILVDRIEDTQKTQKDGQEQFKTALEQFKSVVNFNGGDLEAMYKDLNNEYEASKKAADNISEHIAKVDSVAQALFKEWEGELQLYSNASLRRSSERQLERTQKEYQRLFSSMQRAENSLEPVLNVLHDQVLFLKHNLNAGAIASLRGELKNINSDVSRLIKDMQQAIDESDRFIQQLKKQS